MSEKYETTLTFDLGRQDSMTTEIERCGDRSTSELEAYGPAFVVLDIGGHEVRVTLDYERPCQSVSISTDAPVTITEGPARA